MISGSGVDYKQIALHLIKEFCRDHDMETTLFALEQEVQLEDDFKPTYSLLHLIQSRLEKPIPPKKNVFDSLGIHYGSSLFIDCNTKLTCLAPLKASIPKLDIQEPIDFLILGGPSKVLKLIRPDTGEILRVYDHHASPILSVCTYPLNQKMVVSTAMDGTSVLFDIDGPVIQTFHHHQKYVTRSLFTSNGEYLITASHDKTVCVYHKCSNGLFDLKDKIEFEGVIESMSSFQNTLVVGVREDHMLHYVNLETMEQESVNMNANGDNWVSFSGMDIQVSLDEKYIAVYTDSKSGRVIIYKLKSNEIVLNLWNVQVDEYSQPRLLWHPSGNGLICTSHDTLFVYDLKTGKHEKLRGHTDKIRGICFLGDDLVSCSFDSTVRIWSLSPLYR